MNAIAPAFGCTAGGIPFESVLALVLALVPSRLDQEEVALSECPGRVLAADLVAVSDLPRFDQSAMDGYALCRDDMTPGASLPVTGRAVAGAVPGRLDRGGAWRILTGAPLPAGADAVIAQEHVTLEGGAIEVGAMPAVGANIRRRGEDMNAGQALISAGTTLDWRHVAVLAAQGAARVAVRRQPVVVLLSSGRELRGQGDLLGPGEI